MSNYQFYMSTDLSKYIGEWIVIIDNKVVSNGKDVKKILAKARKKYPKQRPLVTRVPNKEAMIF